MRLQASAFHLKLLDTDVAPANFLTGSLLLAGADPVHMQCYDTFECLRISEVSRFYSVDPGLNMIALALNPRLVPSVIIKCNICEASSTSTMSIGADLPTANPNYDPNNPVLPK